jgi:hypothetical protein
MFYSYSILGISMMLHRYYSHKSFKLDNLAKWFYTVFAVLAGRGSPLGWVYIHRIHHAMDCGQPGCMMCGNPRKTHKDKLTAQEKRMFQDVEKTTDKHSNGLVSGD